MRRQIINLPRFTKQTIAIACDLVMCVLATWLAFSLRLDVVHFPEGYQWHVYQVSPLLLFPVFVRLGLYRSVFRYTGVAAIVSIAKALVIYGLLLFVFVLLQHNAMGLLNALIANMS